MAKFAAGERITASKLSTTHMQAAATEALAPTSTTVDLVGAVLTFNTTRNQVVVRISGVADVDGNGPNTGTIVVLCSVDGVDQPQQILWAGTDSQQRATVTQNWVATLATAGPHTLKLRARRSGGVDGATIQALHTTITALIEDNVS